MSFIDHFSDLEDPRSDINKRYELLDIVFLVATAVMSGAEGWKEIKEFGDNKLEWLRQYRPYAQGIPVDDTIARIIGALSPEGFVSCFMNWVNELRAKEGGDQIAIDGKTLRRSFNGERTTALHSIAAWSKTNGLVLSQMKSQGKKNENVSVLAMLDLLELKGSIVTMDAMNTQKKIVDSIHKKGGDYVLPVKDNHPHLHREIQAYFNKLHQENKLEPGKISRLKSKQNMVVLI